MIISKIAATVFILSFFGLFLTGMASRRDNDVWEFFAGLFLILAFFSIPIFFIAVVWESP
jgi:hypothetical protein